MPFFSGFLSKERIFPRTVTSPISLTISEKSGRQYFICRILTDGICVLTAYLLGGIVGIGTLVCAFGLGPFVQFFSKHIAGPLIYGSGKAE